jgi:hypothetical protein
MIHLAASPAYAENPANMEAATPSAPIRKVNRKSRPNELSAEDEQIIIALNTVKSDMDSLHNRYDQTTDPLLLESIIYELKAANLKYVHFLNMCKDRGIVCRTVVTGR